MMQSSHPKPELIVMLTHQDKTVPEALELFHLAKAAPVRHRGFKGVRLSTQKMQTIVKAIKDAGKITSLEVVLLSEVEGLRGARLSVEFGFEMLMGAGFYPSFGVYMKDKAVIVRREHLGSV